MKKLLSLIMSLTLISIFNSTIIACGDNNENTSVNIAAALANLKNQNIRFYVDIEDGKITNISAQQIEDSVKVYLLNDMNVYLKAQNKPLIKADSITDFEIGSLTKGNTNLYSQLVDKTLNRGTILDIPISALPSSTIFTHGSVTDLKFQLYYKGILGDQTWTNNPIKFAVPLDNKELIQNSINEGIINDIKNAFQNPNITTQDIENNININYAKPLEDNYSTIQALNNFLNQTSEITVKTKSSSVYFNSLFSFNKATINNLKFDLNLGKNLSTTKITNFNVKITTKITDNKFSISNFVQNDQANAKKEAFDHIANNLKTIFNLPSVPTKLDFKIDGLVLPAITISQQTFTNPIWKYVTIRSVVGSHFFNYSTSFINTSFSIGFIN